MRLFIAVTIGFAFLCVAPRAQAQQLDPASPLPPLGSVIAHVSDAATGLPIRSAEVLLVPKPDANLNPPGESNAAGAAQPTQKQPRVQIVRNASDLNGDANLTGVPAGEYFVSALQVAYLTPADTSILSAPANQVNARVAALPSIRVEPGAAVSVSIALHRGAVISGRIQFADGSPAIGLPVGVEYADATPLPLTARLTPNQQLLLSLSESGYNRKQNTTDDQGRYRIPALRPGSYIIDTQLTLGFSSAIVVMDNGAALPGHREHFAPQVVPVFYPGMFRHNDAKRIKITADEEITDANITIDPSGLHTLRGKVLAGDDRHIPSQAFLLLREKGANEPSRFVECDDDGTFQVNYLAPGSYSLVVQANDQESRQSNDPSAPPPKNTLYQAFTIDITISDRDVTLDDILVAPLKPGEPLQPPF